VFVDDLAAGFERNKPRIVQIPEIEAEILERITAEPALLRLPLIRFDSEVSIGRDEATWKRWVSRGT